MTYYFTFGTADYFPFYGGWVEVEAENRKEAEEIFISEYPLRNGLLNCAFVYSEEDFKKFPDMFVNGNFGNFCHRRLPEEASFIGMREDSEHAEFTDEQLCRIDEVYQKVYELAQFLTGKENPNIDSGRIMETADLIAEGFAYTEKVYFPVIVTSSKTGKEVALDYYPSDEEIEENYYPICH